MTDIPNNTILSGPTPLANPSASSGTTVSGSASGGNDAAVLSQAAASLAAVASSLSENMAKMFSAVSSLTENVNKVANSADVSNAANTAKDNTTTNAADRESLNDHRSVENVVGVHGPEALRADNVEERRRSRVHFDRSIVDAQEYTQALRNQHLVAVARAQEHHDVLMQQATRAFDNNNVTTDAVAKQMMRHSDLAITEQLYGQQPELADVSGGTTNDLLAAVQALQAVAQSLQVTAQVQPKTVA